MLCTDNDKLDAELSATTEPGTYDTAAAVNERAADKKTGVAGPPARPQPPVYLTFSVVAGDLNSNE